MGNITLFEYSGYKIRIVVDDSDQPWFVAADVCRCLELAINKRTGKPNVTVATREVADEHKGKFRIQTPENPKNPWIDMMILSEAGLYKVLRRPETVQCQRFKQFIQREILPQFKIASTNLFQANSA